MRIILISILAMVCFTGCEQKEKVLLENFNINQAIISSINQVKLTSFVGNHRVINLEDNDSFLTTGIVTIIKKENIFYVISAFRCSLFDSNGKFIKTIAFPNLLENENAWISGLDICTAGGKPELWVGSGFYEHTIYRVSLEDGERLGTININVPFSDFKRISDDKILIALVQNHFLMATYNLKNNALSYGFKKKLKDAPDGERFIQYNGKHYISYSHTSLAGYYDIDSDSFKETLLTEDDGMVNTWEKQTELMEKTGIKRGVNLAYENYGIINYLIKNKNIAMLTFQFKGKEYISIKRDQGPYKTAEAIPNKHSSLKIDIGPFEDSYRQIINHFYARTYSDDSILLFFLSDRKNILEAKKRKVSIIEVLD